ncbi:MAG: Ig-like domain-containing protein [Pirellulaceae bacterium]
MRDSRRIGLERLEDRNLLAGDIDFFQPLAAEGESSSTLLLHREQEPNDGISVADLVPLGVDMGESSRVEVNGFLTTLADIDVFRADLRGGDILQLNLFGAGQTITVFDERGVELITSSSDANAQAQSIDTGEVSLPQGGNASLGRVLSRDGTFFVQVGGADPDVLGGGYTLQMRIDRPALESEPVGTHQIVFVDFDGAVVPADIFAGTGIASLSPLSSFMANWGLTSADEDAVIDAVMAKLEEDLSTEIRQFGENGDFLATGIPGQFDIEFRNSRDHADPFGQPHVSRIIIGGTGGELGVPGIFGISEGLDVGNLDTTQSAVVLLDILSGQTGAGGAGDLNAIPIATTSSKIELVGAGIAAVAAHEAGHFFGLFHTDDTNAVPNLIDTAPPISVDIGVGPDGIFGSPDDINNGFINIDNYDPTQGFTGIQDTLNTLSWGLSSGGQPSSVSGVKFHDLNNNGIRDLTEPGLAGWTIFADLDGDGMVGLREPQTTTGSDGRYTLSVPPGQHTIREVLQTGWRQTFPTNGSHTVVVSASGTVTDVNFGNVSLFGGISGTKFNDLNGNGRIDQGEPGIPGITIYLDLDGDNRLDLGEPMATTDQNGQYTIAVPTTGTFSVREVLQPGWEQTFPTNAEREHIVVATPGASFPGLDFGNTSQLDYGDAPTAEQSGFANSYPTTIADNGAVHAILPGFHLGTVDVAVDGDPDATPSEGALGDDENTTINDEDGVTFNVATIFPGSAAGEMTVSVVTGGFSPGRINAWIDFNRDGDWDDPGEQIVTEVRAGDGDHVFTFRVPANASSGETYARVRYGYTRNLRPTGPDIAGEVEDHQIRLLSQNPQAVDDQFTITQGDPPTTFAVLDNDIQSLSPPLTVIAAGSSDGVGVTAAGGQVRPSANGTGVVYTPPLNFFGNDSFSYTIRDGAGNTDSADVSVTILPSLVSPLAVDDSFTVQANSSGNQLPILRNDLTGQNPPIGIVSLGNPLLGSVVIDNRGTADTGDDTLVYTPSAGLRGTDQFTYTIQDSVGLSSTATVTVHVDDSDDDRVRIRLQATDLDGNPIQAIGVGEEFNLQVRVADDLRADDEDGDNSVDRFGVAAAYLDILYNFNLVSLSSRQPFFGADFQNATSISTSTPGLINEAGAFQTNQNMPLGRTCQIEVSNATCLPEDNEFLLLTIPMRATATGLANFVGDPADRRTNGPLTPPDHDVLLFNPPEPVLIDQIRYENDSLTIISSGGLPVAVDNTFHVDVNSTNSLDVLANDSEIANPPLRITATGVVPDAPALQGTVSISADGSILTYRPRTGFNGTEQFTYTATNDVGLSDTAVVTVQVGNAPKDVNLRLETTDLNGNPISTIAAGSEFKVRTYVQDIRPPRQDQGVFAVYFDLLYDSNLISTKNAPANRFGFDINFSAPYNTNGLSANNSFFNVIDEIGAFQTGDSALGNSEFLLAEVTFRANTPGVVNLIADPPDLSPFHDVLLFEPPAPVAISRINLGTASITVLGTGGMPGAEGEFTNPENSLDVSGDGFVSPVDVVMVFNDLSSNGSRRLGSNDSIGFAEGEVGTMSVPTGFVDTNGDGHASPIDALAIINFLNSGTLSESEGSSVLFANAATGNLSPAPALSIAPSLAIEPDQARSDDGGESNIAPTTSTAETRAVDALFRYHSQADSGSSPQQSRLARTAGELVSDDLLELLAARESNEI